MSERLTSSHLTSSPGNGHSPPNTLKGEADEKLRLERNNFDLKLKVFHLEEALKKMQDTEVRYEVNNGMARSEASDLRLQLEEKEIQLEQRDLLLMKAKATLENMRGELQRSKLENEKQADLEERMKRLKSMNDDIESDYRTQLQKLEAELAAARQTVGLRDQEKSLLEEKLRQMELSAIGMKDSMDKVHVDKGRAEERWMSSQQTILDLQEDLTQTRALADLYKLQAQEAQDETDYVKEQLKEQQARRKELEEAHRQRAQELNGQYEAQVRTIRANHDQDLEKMRANHTQMMADIRENYQSEVSKARMQMERSVLDIKTTDGMDMQRVKEDYQSRLNEKNSELKALHGVIESDRLQLDNMQAELDTVRVELREKTISLDRMRTDLVAKGDELQVLNALRQDLRDAQRKTAELQDQLRAEGMEKTQLTLRLDQTATSLESSRQTIKELEAEIHLSKVEVHRLTQTTSELGTKADGVESLARDNEKLRILYAKMQQDILEANHKAFNTSKDHQRVEEEYNRSQEEVHLCRQEISMLREHLLEGKVTIEKQQISTQYEREQRLALEAALSEQRAGQVSMRQELQEMRNKLSSAETNSTVQADDLEHKLHKLIQTNAMARRSLLDCDDALSLLLDGEADQRDFQFSRMSSSAGHSNRGSPRKGNAHGKHSQRNESDDYDSMRESVANGVDDVRHEVAMLIERVAMKMERAVKIRSLLDSQTSKMVQRLETVLHSAHERCSLLMHRVDACQAEEKRLKNIFDRDREASRKELEEVKKLREVLLYEHSASLREHEGKYAQLLLLHEQERMHHEQLKRTTERLQDDLKAAHAASNQQKEELKALDQMESMLSGLEAKMNALSEANRNLQKESSKKDHHLQQMETTCNDLKKENSLIISEGEKLMIQLQNKADMVADADDRSQRLLAEIDRLRARQIDPELASALRDSQEKLKRSEASSADHVTDMKEIELGLRVLVKKSELLMSRAENVFLSDRADGQLINLQEEVRMLMEENRSLLHRVNALHQAVRSEMSGSPAARSPTSQSAKAIAAEIVGSRRYQEPAAPARADLYRSTATRNSAPSMPAFATSTRTTKPLAETDSFFFPSRRGLMTPTSRFQENTVDAGYAGQGMQLDDLRDEDQVTMLMHRPPNKSTRSNKDSAAGVVGRLGDGNRMNRLHGIDQHLRVLSQKLDAFDLGK